MTDQTTITMFIVFLCQMRTKYHKDETIHVPESKTEAARKILLLKIKQCM